MRITIKNIADKLGLSHATVSRVLNDKASALVSQDTRQRVLQMADELGYRPNRMAQALVTGRTQTAALWAYSVYPAYYSYMIYLLGRNLSDSGYEMQVVETSEQNKMPGIADWPVDGIIAFDCPENLRAFMKTNHHTPVVSIGAGYCEESDYVGLHLYSGTVEAVHHLVNSGRRRIAFLGGDTYEHGDIRCEAYKFAMNEAGLEPIFIPVDDQHITRQRVSARKAIFEYLKHHKCPDAIFGYTDHFAIGAHRALRDLGIRIPEDVALVGCDGIEDCEYLDPPLTTIQQPFSEMADLAWTFLQRRLNDPSIPQQTAILKTELVIRGSSAGCLRDWHSDDKTVTEPLIGNLD